MKPTWTTLPWRRSLLILGALGLLEMAASAAGVTLWTTGKSLLPGWGLYPNGQPYGGTTSLDEYAAWNSGRLTWVAEFPSNATYQVFVRRYAGTGGTTVTLDEGPPVHGGKGRLDPPGRNDCYIWENLGPVTATKGPHHVDLQIAGMFDAVAFSTDPAFDPSKDQLPDPVIKPVLRAPRRYRDDSPLRAAAGRPGFVVASIAPYEEALNDTVPGTNQVIRTLRLWGAADQYVNGSFVVRALRDTQPLTATLERLSGPNHTKIKSATIDLRVVGLRRRALNFVDMIAPGVLLPDLLLRDDRTAIPPKGKQGGYGGGRCVTAIPAHESRQFWLTVHVPQGSPPGIYKGTIRLRHSLFRGLALPVEIEVLPLDLKPVEGYYGIYHPSHPIAPEVQKREGHFIPLDRYRAELADQVRHGFNATTLYGGPTTLSYAKEAGMTQPPNLMQWPAADAHANEYIAQAKALGFPDLYFCGVDEPKEPDRLEQCRKEAEWRRQNGFHMMTAINSRESYEVLKDLVDRPILLMSVFSGPDNPSVMYARSKGFIPVSYWMTATPFPLWNRSLAGLYNTRCGYLGTSPWAYQNYPDSRIWDENKGIEAVAYPDEFGEPIPSLSWEGYRAGVDDVRYLQALDRALAAADDRLKQPAPPDGLADAVTKARAVRAARFESITGLYFQYLIHLKPGTLDASRREMADATLEIENRRR
ncbi:MAG: DUF4091 domain-containing protein [Verrucomicrobiae bacterium]|nr:DUF4091 domain-containing protein [Verrucomicrobiae bacterium]